MPCSTVQPIVVIGAALLGSVDNSIRTTASPSNPTTAQADEVATSNSVRRVRRVVSIRRERRADIVDFHRAGLVEFGVGSRLFVVFLKQNDRTDDGRQAARVHLRPRASRWRMRASIRASESAVCSRRVAQSDLSTNDDRMSKTPRSSRALPLSTATAPSSVNPFMKISKRRNNAISS